jgi:hypothetical protein
MPEDIPKAVMVLLWLLVGVIIFGWLLMTYPTVYSIIFAILFFGVPVAVYKKIYKEKS